MFHHALFKFIRITGSRKKAAKLLRVGVKVINNLFTRDRKVKLEYALRIEIVSTELSEKDGTDKINAESIAPYAAKEIKDFKKMIIREFLKNQGNDDEPHTHN